MAQGMQGPPAQVYSRVMSENALVIVAHSFYAHIDSICLFLRFFLESYIQGQ
jgi:hypothetical protein